MILEANAWFRVNTVLDGQGQVLADGTEIHTAGHHSFQGSRLRAFTGEAIGLERYGYFVWELQDVVWHAMEDVPPVAELQRRLLRDNLVALTGVRYGFDLHARTAGRETRSTGLVTVRLGLDTHRPSPTARHEEVQTAFQRGLLDARQRDRADFRLGLAALRSRMSALAFADYVPRDMMSADILFAHWFTLEENEFVQSPIPHGSNWQDLELKFVPRRHPAGFRLSDLFKVRE